MLCRSHKDPPNLDELRALLQAGANVNGAEPFLGVARLNPLAYAARRNHCTVDTLRFLLENGADISYLNGLEHSDMPPLTFAVHGGGDKKDEKIRLLFEAGADVNAYDKHSGRSVLWEITGWASAELIEDALRRGARVNRVFNKLDWEPIHLAAYIGRVEVVELCLRYGADPLARDKNGQTPRMLAEEEKVREYFLNGRIHRREPALGHEDHPACVRLLLAAEQEACKSVGK